jgi:hypothetical protein
MAGARDRIALRQVSGLLCPRRHPYRDALPSRRVRKQMQAIAIERVCAANEAEQSCAHALARNPKQEERPMADARPQLAASEIEAELAAEAAHAA